eukprot:2295035-Prymnesium_polylepis.1
MSQQPSDDDTVITCCGFLQRKSPAKVAPAPAQQPQVPATKLPPPVSEMPQPPLSVSPRTANAQKTRVRAPDYSAEQSGTPPPPPTRPSSNPQKTRVLAPDPERSTNSDDDDDDDDDDESRVVTQSELNAVTKQYEALLGRVEKLEEAAGVRQLPVSDDGHDILGAAEQGMQLTTTSKDLVR